MAKKLKNMRIDAVGVVDKGANQDAMIVLAKRLEKDDMDGDQDAPKSEGPCPTCGGDHPQEGHAAAMRSKKDKPEPATKSVGTGTITKEELVVDTKDLEKQLADAKAEAETARKELDTLKGAGTLTSDAETLRKQYEKTQEGLEKARADLQKQLDEATAEKAAALAEVEKIQKSRRREKFIKRAADLNHLPGAPVDDFGEFLDDVEKAIGEKRFTKFLNQLDSWNTLVEKSAVFTEMGAGSGGEYSLAGPEAQLDILAKERAAKDKISYPKAYDLVLKSPEGKAIYKRHLTQVRKEQ